MGVITVTDKTTMGRPKGKPVAGLYVRSAVLRVPLQAVPHLKAALNAWEVSTALAEVREARRLLAEFVKATTPPSKAAQKRNARAIALRKGKKG